MTVKIIKGMEEVFAPYEGFIFDLWGVIHDGEKPNLGTIEILQLLKKAERKIYFLSNAPRRANDVRGWLTKIGIDEALYDGILTSGEMSWKALKNTLLNKWGKNCFHLGPDEHKAIYEGLNINIVENISEADFILNSGLFKISDIADDYNILLEEALTKRIPMLCANPDKIVHIGEALVVCSGALAELYESLGGKVTYFGKPYREVYKICKNTMGTSNILAVGDAMETDIKGANGAGIDSLLVLSGIHRNDVSLEDINDFTERHSFAPDYVISSFKW